MEQLIANDTHVPHKDDDGVVRMYEIPDWWKGSAQDVCETVKLVKKGEVEELCKTPGGWPVYMVRYGKKNDLKRTANLSSAMGGGDFSAYADKSGEDYVPTVCMVGACHGGEFEGTVAINNLIKNIETGTDYAGNENKELMDALKNINLLLIPCANMDGRARIPLRTMVGQSRSNFRRYCHGLWNDGTECMHPECKTIHPIKEQSSLIGGYFNDDGVNIVHDNFFFPMAEETKALLKIADEYVPDITLHLHSGAYNRPTFFLFDYMPKPVRDRMEELSHRVAGAYEALGIGEQFFDRPIKDRSEDGFPSFNISSAWTAICGEPCIIHESNQGVLMEDDLPRRNPHSFLFEDIYLHHQILFKETFNYVKECKK